MVTLGGPCSKCGCQTTKYDEVCRVVKDKGGVKKTIRIKRYRCSKCKTIHRSLPDYVYPYKQYRAEIIEGVVEGLITPETLGFEDYPCEATMERWKKEDQ